MKNEQLLPRILEMPYEDLLKKIQSIRDARVDARAASEGKKTKRAKPKKAAVDKIVDKMTEDERAKLITLLEGEDENKITGE